MRLLDVEMGTRCNDCRSKRVLAGRALASKRFPVIHNLLMICVSSPFRSLHSSFRGLSESALVKVRGEREQPAFSFFSAKAWKSLRVCAQEKVDLCTCARVWMCLHTRPCLECVRACVLVLVFV